MATTAGLTIATTSAILGSGGALFSVGGSVQPGLIGEGVEVGVGGGLGVGEMSTLGINSQPTPKRRDKTITKQITKYFTFALFISDLYCSIRAQFEQK
jgi:hypothetical protein